jgi:hypothetical protein
MERGVHPADLKRLGRHRSFDVLCAHLKFGDLFDCHPLSGVLQHAASDIQVSGRGFQGAAGGSTPADNPAQPVPEDRVPVSMPPAH